MSRPPSQPGLRARMRRHRIIIGALTGIVLVLGIGFPLAIAYDSKVDSMRTAYDDAADMAELQQMLVDDEEPVQELDLEPGQTATVGSATFTPRPGNSVSVTGTAEGFCVQATNEDPEIPGYTFDSAEPRHEYDEIRGGACG